MSTLFISHSSRDNAAAKELQAKLEEQGHRSVFLDLDPEAGIQAGVSWERTLYTKLRACRAVVALCSDSYLASQWCFAEIALARMEGKELFVLQIDPWSQETQMPSILTEEQFIDLRTDKDDGYRRLWNGFKVKGIVPEEHRKWGPEEPPYPGLRAFDEADEPIFFGRDRELREGVELISRVRRQGHPRLVMVLGSSGSGKSSLTRAGIVPRLRRDKGRWLIVGPFRPGPRPALKLAAALAAAFEAAGKPRSLDRILGRLGTEAQEPGTTGGETPRSEAGAVDRITAREMLRQALRRMESELAAEDSELLESVARLKEYFEGSADVPGPEREPTQRAGESVSSPLAALTTELCFDSGLPEAKVVLVIDQFEELLGHEDAGEDHPANRFLHVLRDGIEGEENPPLCLGTMRSDFLGMLQRSGPWRGVGFKSLSVGPMSEEGLLKVIEEPATLGQIELERPDLTHRLLRETGTSDALPLLAFTLRAMWDRYHETRRFDVQGYEALGGLHGAIAQVADDTMEAALAKSDEGTEKDLRLAFLSLARPAAEGSGWARRPVSWEGLPARVQPMIEQFIDQRLLIKRSDGTVEVAHEALFRSWETLRRWLNTNSEALLLRREIHVEAAKWEQADSEEEKEPYLWRGARLGRALELRGGGVLTLDRSEDDFVEASDRAERARIEAKEARRRRELRRTRIFAAVVSAAFLVAVALGVYALIQKNEAQEQMRVSAAGEWLTRDPTRAGLILWEMERPHANPLAISRLGEALGRSLAVAEMRAHTGDVRSAAFSPEGGRIVTASADKTVRVWNTDGTGSPIVLRGHGDRVQSAAFGPRGKRIVTASWDKTARVWNADGTGDPVQLSHSDRVQAATFSPDGRRIVTVSVDSVARLWNADGSGDPIELRGHEKPIQSAAFSPNGTRIVTASSDATARVWWVDGSGETVVLRGHDGGVQSAVFSPDGTRILTASLDRKVRLWSADGTGEPLELEGPGTRVSSARFSPKGDRIVTAYKGDSTVRVWNADGLGTPVVLEGHGSDVLSAAFSPDGRRIVTASWDTTARVWDADGSGTPIVLEGHEARLRNAAFSPDGTHIVTTSVDKVVRVWGSSGSGYPIVLNHGRRVQGASFSPNGKRLVSASWDKTARVWNADGSGETIDLRHGAAVESAVFSPDGRRIVTASWDNKAWLWNADGSGEPVVLTGHEDAVLTAAFSPDGKRVATASQDDTARVWPLDGSGEPLVLQHGADVKSAVFSPDGDRILTASWDNKAWLWNADGSGEPTGLDHGAGVERAVFSPDGRLIATASLDAKLRVWDADGSGDPIVLEGHGARVVGVAFSPDGKQIVSGSVDKTIRVWSADGSGEPVVLKGHRDAVQSVAFGPEGKRVISASKDGTARVWIIDGALLQKKLRAATRLCLDPSFRRRSLGESPRKAIREHTNCERSQGRAP